MKASEYRPGALPDARALASVRTVGAAAAGTVRSAGGVLTLVGAALLAIACGGAANAAATLTLHPVPVPQSGAEDPDPEEPLATQGDADLAFPPTADADGESALGVLVVSMAQPPVESLVNVFRPATSHLARTNAGAGSRIVAVSWSGLEAPWWQPSLSYVVEHDAVAFGAGQLAQPVLDNRAGLLAQNAALEWSLGDLRVGVRASRAVEQASGIAASAAATRVLGRGSYVGWQLAPNLVVELDLGADRVRDSGVVADWSSRSLSAQWQGGSGLTVSSSLYDSRSTGTDFSPALRVRAADVTIGFAFGSGGSGTAAQPRTFLRFERQALSGDNVVFAPDAPAKTWSVSFGLAASF